MQKSKWDIDEKLLTGAKLPLYYSLRYLDMEKQDKLLQDTNLKILLLIYFNFILILWKGVLEPLTPVSTDLKISKESNVLIQVIAM